ncbi:MAG: hypothetical protein LBD51_04335 [Bifidobacteriaceae bacterium]|nr:hypothetical protein [Bifidobacteriaceae bacterium]
MRPALFALAGRKRQSEAVAATGPRPVTASDLRAAGLGQAFAAWNDELARLGGTSAEVDIAALGNTVLDLTLAHPSGIAQLYAGRTTELRSLIRDKVTCLKASAAAEALKAKADQHAAAYGLPPTHLGLGIALWTETDADTGRAIPRRVPVMLRPIVLERGAHGIELELEPNLAINPELTRVLSDLGIPLDPEAMARAAMAGASFNPSPVFDAIAAMGQAVFEDFRVKNKLIVGVFEHPGKVLAADLADARAILMSHPLVAALAGDLESRSQLALQPVAPPVPYDRPPDHERGVGDLNVSQLHVLDVAAAGTSALIDAPAGAPVAATVAAVVSDAVGSGRSVLYVSGNARAKQAAAKLLRAFGLGECLLDLEPTPDWRGRSLAHLVAGLAVSPPAVDPEAIGQIRTALARRSNQIADYLAALHEPLPGAAASPFDALQALAQITEESPETRTTCELDRDTVKALTGEAREQAKAALRRATELGLFKLTPEVTAWLGVKAATAEDAAALLERLDRLRAGSLARAIDHMRDVTGRTGLGESENLAGWGEQLDMLRGVRQALDQFIPEIFESSPADMVAATATPEWRAEHDQPLSRRQRGRLRRQARDLVRPGLQVDDLHQALVQVETQRNIWLSWSPSVPWPKLPVGMRQVEAEYEAVAADLAALDAALPEGHQPLAELAFGDLGDFLNRLHIDRDSMDFLPELSQVTDSLRGLGLGPLVDDLLARRAGPELAAAGAEAEAAMAAVAFEVDFAWWSSLLAQALADNPSLSSMSGDTLNALVDSYRELDIAHTATKPLPIRAAAVNWRDRAAEDYPAQLFKLSHLEAGASLRQALALAPEVGFAARPCIMAGPVMVPQAIPLTELGAPPLDLVIIDGADSLTPAQAVAALARGKQALVIGDATRPTNSTLTGAAAEFLPRVPLPAVADARDPRVTELLEAQGYLTLGPALPSRSHDPRITWTHVDATGQAAGDASRIDRIDAAPAEVEAAAALVESHLTRWPAESLAVFTATPEHAARVLAALERAAKSGNQLLARALATTGPEALLVAAADQAVGVSRDGVIFAPGLARSPRGAVMYEFGQFAGDFGGVLLADVLLAGRRRLAVVSSLTAEDLDDDRLRGGGPQLFKEVLSAAAHPKVVALAGPQVSDALFADLARRVERRGTHVTANYGPAAGPWVKLAVRPDPGPANELVAVMTDDPAFMAEPSLRAKIRLWPAALAAAGWHVHHSWTAPVFMEPEAEASRIAKAVFASNH